MQAIFGNRHSALGGVLGAVFGGLVTGVAVGGVLLALSLILIALTPYGVSSAHGMSFAEMGIIGLFGSFILTPLSALAGAVGGGVAGAVDRPAPVRVALATAAGGIATGLLAMLWTLSEAANWDRRDVLVFALVSTFLLGGMLGAVAGAIGGLVGNLVRKKVAAV